MNDVPGMRDFPGMAAAQLLRVLTCPFEWVGSVRLHVEYFVYVNLRQRKFPR